MSEPPGRGWIRSARDELVRSAIAGGRWGYRPGGTAFAEPTALACLALQATDSTDKSRDMLAAAARWLASIQQKDGCVGLSDNLPLPGWTTPYAVLVWAGQDRFAAELGKATDWLVHTRGQTFPRSSSAGDDSSIAGWPWVADTFSWLEPTAMAVMALKRCGMAGHPRTIEGLRLIRDRAIDTGGWNFGNSSVYATNLRAQPAETGIALVALSGTGDATGVVAKACRYLQGSLSGTMPAQSISWCLLGLTAWGLRPSSAEDWLAQAFEAAIRERDSVTQLAYLLLASASRSLRLFGVETDLQ